MKEMQLHYQNNAEDLMEYIFGAGRKTTSLPNSA